MEKAIRKAMEGGWKHEDAHTHVLRMSFPFSKYEYCTRSFLMDPQFWQCLVKGIGWKSDYTRDDPEWTELTIDEMQYRTPRALWHRFIDHIADGKSVDSFFEEIIGPEDKSI